MSAAAAIGVITSQLDEFRNEDVDWCIVPEEDDPELDCMKLVIRIVAPDTYGVHPKGGDANQELPYKGGIFRVLLEFPDDYPTAPPTVYFKTYIWHPLVDEATGKVCGDNLTASWDKTKTVKNVAEFVLDLIASPPSAEDGTTTSNAKAGAQVANDFEGFEKHARSETVKHAIGN